MVVIVEVLKSYLNLLSSCEDGEERVPSPLLPSTGVPRIVPSSGSSTGEQSLSLDTPQCTSTVFATVLVIQCI